HTVHATWDDAAEQVDEAIRIYNEFYRRLAIPTTVSKRPEWDKFPGADYTMAVDVLMPDGKTLQAGTAHHLADHFAKTFDITYEDPEGEQKLVHQTCYGVSERCIAAMISVHGDDNGLILPPEVAPVQVVIIPIIFGKKTEPLDACKQLHQELKDAGIRAELDDTDKRPGAKYYKWEMKGVPIRIEIGPRDLKENAATIAHRNSTKEVIPLDGIVTEIKARMELIQSQLLEQAEKRLFDRIFDCATLDEAKNAMNKGIARVSWCGSVECGKEMEEIVGAGMLGIPAHDQGPETNGSGGSAPCPICGKPTENVALMAKTY
ncbi:MAG: proline--tRNA ligase, partial [Methanosarcinales archaeon]|nr:proline--tRNA ligase [Methanosarcinales archaeon]